MESNKMLRFSLYVGVLISILHVFAVQFFIYWFYWWFDIPLHFLGGLCVGFFALWLNINYGKNFLTLPFKTFLIVFAVGIIWEIFEYFTGLTFKTLADYRLDTIKDLFMDVLGGYVSYWYYKTLVNKYK